jgi:uncharacterized protein YciI
LPQPNFIVFALAEGIAAWNCELQSEKSILVAGRLGDDEPAEPVAVEVVEAELLAELAVLAGAVARLVDEVQAALVSRATPATSADRRVARRGEGTR